MTYSAGNQELIPRGQQPVTVVIPEGRANPPVNNVTVNINITLFGGKWWLILIMAFLAYDWYFNGWGYTSAAKDFISSKLPQGVTQAYVPTGLPMNPSLYAGISSGFGNRVVNKTKGFHGGIDYKAPAGTSVLATAQGVVVNAGALDNNCGYGVKVDHGNGYATIVCHLSKVTVTKGQRIHRGGELGKSGGVPGSKGSGRSTGPHIHYAVKYNGKVINPTKLATLRQPTCVVPADINKRGILDYVECRGKRAGLPTGYMAVTAIIESGADTKALNTGSQAVGLYQFIPSTAKEYGLKNPHNLVESTTAAIKYVKTFTGSQDAVTLYMQHNQGVCGYKIITEMASLGTADMVCGTNDDGDVTHKPADIYKNIRSNTNGDYKRIIRTQGEFNKKSASAYINFMKKVYWPKGVRQWKTITSQW